MGTEQGAIKKMLSAGAGWTLFCFSTETIKKFRLESGISRVIDGLLFFPSFCRTAEFTVNTVNAVLR